MGPFGVSLNHPKAGVMLALLFTGSMWFYVERVLVPHQQRTSVVEDRPRGNLSDLYPRWLGARELLLHHRDPYSPEVTREIQAGYYGRPLDPSRPGDPKDKQGFAYPVYVVFLLALTVKLPFPLVQAVFRWLLVALVAVTVLLWLRVLRWQVSVAVKVTLLVFTFGAFGVVQGIELQQLSLLVSALLAVCAVLLLEGHQLSAGIILAFATIKPQLVWLLAGWLFLWAVSDVRRRQKFLWGFCITFALLVSGAEVLLPGWLGEFRRALAEYRQYTGGAYSLLEVLLTPAWGRVLNGAIVCAAAALSWRLRHESAGSPRFAFVLSVVLATTVVVAPTFAPYNQLLLLPAVVLVLSHWDRFGKTSGRRLARALAGAMVGWPWITAFALMIASLFLSPVSIQRAWAVPLLTSLGIPLAVLTALALGVSDFVKAEAGQVEFVDG
jgi:hypothetical protein